MNKDIFISLLVSNVSVVVSFFVFLHVFCLTQLPENISDEEHRNYFCQAGNLTQAIVNDGSEGPKGTGLLIYGSPDDAQKAIKLFNDKEWRGRVLNLRKVYHFFFFSRVYCMFVCYINCFNFFHAKKKNP